MANQEKLLRLKAVKELTGLGKSTIYDRMKKGEFPNRIHLGAKSSAWLESEIQEWISQRVLHSRKSSEKSK
jgi:prophage regulatory protein